MADMRRKGPFSFAIYRLGEGFPMSNLHRDGCKHDVLVATGGLLEAGIPQPCSKCGALLIPWPVFRAATTAFIDAWTGDYEVINQALPSEEEVKARQDYSASAEALWALADMLDPSHVNSELRDAVRKVINAKRGG